MTYHDWQEWDRASSSLVSQAAGWAQQVDAADDEQVLAWAREFLPRILAHSTAFPGGAR